MPNISPQLLQESLKALVSTKIGQKIRETLPTIESQKQELDRELKQALRTEQTLFESQIQALCPNARCEYSLRRGNFPNLEWFRSAENKDPYLNFHETKEISQTPEDYNRFVKIGDQLARLRGDINKLIDLVVADLILSYTPDDGPQRRRTQIDSRCDHYFELWKNLEI